MIFLIRQVCASAGAGYDDDDDMLTVRSGMTLSELQRECAAGRKEKQILLQVCACACVFVCAAAAAAAEYFILHVRVQVMTCVCDVACRVTRDV